MPRKTRSRTPARSRSRRRSASRKRSETPPPRQRRTKPLNPRTMEYEWGGPVGAFGMVFFLPAIVLVLNTLCSESMCSVEGVYELPDLLYNTIMASIPQLPLALGIEVAWLFLHAVLYVLPIGKRVEGMKLRNGETLVYNINAVYVFILIHAVIGALHYHGLIHLAVIADMFVPLMIASIIISAVMSIILYLASFRSASVLLSTGGNTGNPVYDFWIGRELNPRTFSLDWKFMCELRPGLIGWSLLNWAFVVKSMETGTYTPSILIIAVLESLYVFDGLLLEAGNLTMMDIVHDGFGFMLCFGDLSWVPFTYTLKTKFLAYHPLNLSPTYVACCCLLALTGYIIFRGSNSQKNKFRQNPRDPSVAHLKVLRTSRGKSLLISGYWGVCRHPNYVGDWLMTLAWSALTGTTALLPYYQPVYFAALLMHRQLRDERQMEEKYGEADWRKFCGIVQYRLIPFIY
ncbi:putative C-14 sterol reductase [Trypanosoma theileri]|uniref:Putative C-14 sterol reductase n=1 Tax=Trypanosoma theileri TaxID=67003 RepID=A0A1X0NRH6_9TRYP|nr:putative C-14 sterol reductase [Trypanosoma theileri]XP_028882295.1 putative C-14 sterol reductase [Trypanosoma theileri]ORC87304.1 putative C-14 sterol reductase [Trypanosoma theileri]ORC88229.1 putative C-14 sterol reductase [Trypanosoma theileri]